MGAELRLTRAPRGRTLRRSPDPEAPRPAPSEDPLPFSLPGPRTAVLALCLSWGAPLAGQAPERVEYRIDATVAASPVAVTARATIGIPRGALARPTEIRLGLGLEGGRRLVVSAVGDSTARTGDFTTSADSLTLVAPIAPGPGRAVLMVEYRVELDSASRNALGYHLASAVTDAAAWYPAVLDLPDSLARFRRFRVHVEVPRGMALLASGALVDSVLSETGTLYRYEAEDVEGVALALGTEHRVETVASGRTTVRALAPHDARAPFLRAAAAAAETAEWYRETYGFFPVREIGLLPGYARARGGFPLPQVFMIHQGDLSESFLRWITAHELAHYYWGLWVLDPDERLGWLTLGLGIWTDQLYLARTAGRSVAEQWRRVDADNSFEDYATALIGGLDQRLGLPDSVAAALPFDYNSLVRHGKGATAMYLVARELGEDRFVALQRDLLASHARRPLAQDELVRAVAAAGHAGAGALLARWAEGDARIDYAVRWTRRDGQDRSRYWIGVERTGTVAYPVTIEARTRDGRSARAIITGSARLDSAAVTLAAPPSEVRLDPDGEVPMGASDHPDMRRVFLMARGTAGDAREFLAAADRHLARHPDPHLAARVIERLFALGRHRDVFRTAQRFPEAVSCLDRSRCFAALQVARALVHLGMAAGAQAWLQNVEPAMVRLGVSGGRRLEDARREIRPEARRP